MIILAEVGFMVQKKVFILLMIMALALVPGFVFAQLKSQALAPNLPEMLRSIPASTQGLLGIIGFDPAKFHMSHSYSMSYFSMGGKGMTQGLYLNTMSYRFSDPLLLKLQFGYAHQPFNAFGRNVPLVNNGFFVSGAELIYKPLNNMTVHFQFNRLPNQSYYYMNPFLFNPEE